MCFPSLPQSLTVVLRWCALCLDWHVMLSTQMHPGDWDRTPSLGFFSQWYCSLNLRKHKKGTWWYRQTVVSNNHFMNFFYLSAIILCNSFALGLTEHLYVAITVMSPRTIVASYVFIQVCVLPQLLLQGNLMQVCDSSTHLADYWNSSDFTLLLLKAEIDTETQKNCALRIYNHTLLICFGWELWEWTHRY